MRGIALELKRLLEKTCEIAKGAGKLILSMERPQVFSKEGHANFVTEADIASQKYILERLAPLLPEAHFFAEEQENNVMEPGDNWVVDPIDGTTNFMRGCRHSAISIGLVRDGESVLGVVYNPYTDELFSAVKQGGAFLNGEKLLCAQTPLESALVVFGTSPYYRDRAEETFRVVKRIFLACGDIRRSGSAALDLCYVAAGRCDGFYESILSPWDYAASAVILREAGAKIGTIGEAPLDFCEKQPVLAASSTVYEELLSLVSEK